MKDTIKKIEKELISFGFAHSLMSNSEKKTAKKSYQITNILGEKIRVFFKKTSFRIEKHDGKRWINQSEKTYYFTKYKDGISGTDANNLLCKFNCGITQNI